METNVGHPDFNGIVEFTCSAIDKLTAIDLGYFAAFPETSKLVTTLNRFFGPKVTELLVGDMMATNGASQVMQAALTVAFHRKSA